MPGFFPEFLVMRYPLCISKDKSTSTATDAEAASIVRSGLFCCASLKVSLPWMHVGCVYRRYTRNYRLTTPNNTGPQKNATKDPKI